MATKKDVLAAEEKAGTEAAAQAAEGAAAQAAEEVQAAPPVNEWDEKLTVYVPRKAKGDDQSWFVMVNDRPFYIPANGKMQELPKPVALILASAVDAEAAAEEYSNKVTEEAMNAKRFL